MQDKSDKIVDKTKPAVVKKYANRRLYNTETSTYVTLEDLATMVRAERDFVVYDAKSGDDLTHSVLTQIIVEQESRPGGNPMLPIPFLRQLIRFYGQGIERMVPSYLQVSMESFAKNQERFTDQVANAFGGGPFDAYKDMAAKNLEMFEKSIALWSPFGLPGMPGAAKAGEGKTGQQDAPPARQSAASGSESSEDLAEMKAQLDAMQKTIEKLSKDRG